jgi:hypothetical protein
MDVDGFLALVDGGFSCRFRCGVEVDDDGEVQIEVGHPKQEQSRTDLYRHSSTQQT